MNQQKQVWIFFGITLALSALIAFASYQAGDENISILSVFTPTLAAIVLTGLAAGRAGIGQLLKGQFKGNLTWRWAGIGFWFIPIVAALSIWGYSFFGGPALGLRSAQILPQVIVILLISFGEEYGWRGFALPRLLEKYSAATASLILGLAWGVWHFPAYLIGTGVPLDMPFYIFMLWTLGATFFMTWVYRRTESVLGAILIHSAANATFNYLPLLPEFVGTLNVFLVFLAALWLGLVAIGALKNGE